MDNLVSKEEGVWTKEITKINMKEGDQEDLTKNSEDLVEVPAKDITKKIEVPAIKGAPNPTEDNLAPNPTEDNLAPNPTEDNLILNQGTNQKKKLWSTNRDKNGN